jgi:menaquinone-dependent protoporphyrinogen IX oxidase
MNILILYNSKTGFTEKYSNWIAEELKCDIKPYKLIKNIDLMKYGLIIYGSRIHAGRIENLVEIKKLFKNNTIKKLIVFATGATPITAKIAIDNIWTKNFTENELLKIPHYYYLQSGLNYERMNNIDKMMMKVLALVLNKKKNKDQIENETETAIKKSHDNSSKEYVTPLIEDIKNNYK